MNDAAAKWWVELLIATPIYIYAMVRPAVFWRMRFALTRWAHRGGQPPLPSRAGLWVVRGVATLMFLLVAVSAIQRGVA